jgi:hypothetical protein
LTSFFAVAEVVIRDRGDNDTTGIAASDLEGTAVVIEFVFLFPAHTVALLAFGGVFDIGQTELDLGSTHKVWCKDDATAMTCPMSRIKGGVVFTDKRVTAVAEDGFDEVEITN